MSRHRIPRPIFVLALCAVAAPAWAQMDFPMASIHADTVIAGIRLCNGLDRNLGPGGMSCEGRSGGPRRAPSAQGQALAFRAPAARPRAAAPTPTTYSRSPAVTAQVQRQYVDFVRKISPQEAAKVEGDFRRLDHVAVWSGLVSADGLKSGDVADAFTAYWILNWVMANHGDNDRAQTLAVREQVRRMLPSVPAFADLTEPQRQEMAEALMINFNYQQKAYVHALQTGDRQMAARLGEAARQRFQKEMGLDLRGLELTENGFVKRG